MGASPAGAVVLLPFPFSDLAGRKLRPAVVLADAGRGDRILCQVTSRPYGDDTALALDASSFARGSLRVVSYARPTRLVTASLEVVQAEVAALNSDALRRIVEGVVRLLRAGGVAPAAT